MSGWQAVLRKLSTAGWGAFPSRFLGYGRRAVDKALRHADERLTAALRDAVDYGELADVMDEQLALARADLAEYDRLHAGEDLRNSVDPVVRAAIARARHDADAVVEDARREVRILVERASVDQRLPRQRQWRDKPKPEEVVWSEVDTWPSETGELGEPGAFPRRTVR